MNVFCGASEIFVTVSGNEPKLMKITALCFALNSKPQFTKLTEERNDFGSFQTEIVVNFTKYNRNSNVYLPFYRKIPKKLQPLPDNNNIENGYFTFFVSTFGPNGWSILVNF